MGRAARFRVWIVRMNLNRRIRTLRLAKIEALRDAEQATAEAGAIDQRCNLLHWQLEQLPADGQR